MPGGNCHIVGNPCGKLRFNRGEVSQVGRPMIEPMERGPRIARRSELFNKLGLLALQDGPKADRILPCRSFQEEGQSVLGLTNQ